MNLKYYILRESTIKKLNVSLILLLIVLGLFVISVASLKYFEHKKRLKMSKEEKFFSLQKSKLDPDNMTPILIIPDNELTLEREFESGAFGKVFIGFWRTKTPKTDQEIQSNRNDHLYY